MSGIRSTGGPTPTVPVETGKGNSATTQQVTPVNPSSATGGQSNPAVPQSTAVSALTEGATVAAIVTARATGGDTMLHTEVGNFRMTSSNPIPVGSHVVLEVDAVDDLITAKVVSINGEKLAAPPTVKLLPILNQAPQPQDTYGLAKAPLPSDLGSSAQNISAVLGKAQKVATPTPSQTVVTQTPPQSPTQTTTPPTTPGKSSNAWMTSSLSNLTASTQSVQPVQTGAAAYAHTTTPGLKGEGNTPITNAPDTSKTQLPAGQVKIEVVKATVDAPALNQNFYNQANMGMVSRGQQLPLLIQPSTGQPIASTEAAQFASGTVISLSGPIRGNAANSGQVQVHVQSPELGTLRYSTSSPPATGTQISISFSEKLIQFPLQVQLPTGDGIKTPHLPLMIEWSHLRDALNTVAAFDPDVASTILTTRIPGPNANLGASLLFFISALSGGNIGKWMGPGLQNVLDKTGNSELFRALSDDFANISRLSTENGGNDWRAIIFPFHADDRLHQLRMFYRKHSKHSDDNKDEETRFLIELDLSKTGPVQLDGFLREKSFDLVFRHQIELDPNIKSKVSDIFIENMEITGFKGTLIFRKSTPFPVQPTQEWETRDSHPVDA